MVLAQGNQFQVPDSPSHPCPVLHQIIHYFATGKENAPFSCMVLREDTFSVQGTHSPADAHPSLPCIAEIFWGQPKSDVCPSPPLWGTDTLESQRTAHLRWQQGLRDHQITPDRWQNWGELQIHRIMKSLGPSARLIVYFRSLSAITSTNGYRTPSKHYLKLRTGEFGIMLKPSR